MTAGDLLEGRYELEAQLGAGGTARVYRARDLVTEASVAIKLMEAGREEDPEAVAYFSQEGRLAARIRDPHLVPALHFGVDEGRHFIVYDYLPGTSPLSELAELGRVAPKRVCKMALQVLYALDTLHRANVLHGDVSLSNCLWRERDGGRDEVRLCDLGCAWVRSPCIVVSGAPAEPSDNRGTAYYTAPEIENEEAGDHRADLWSVGAMMYARRLYLPGSAGRPRSGEARKSRRGPCRAAAGPMRRRRGVRALFRQRRRDHWRRRRQTSQRAMNWQFQPPGEPSGAPDDIARVLHGARAPPAPFAQ